MRKHLPVFVAIALVGCTKTSIEPQPGTQRIVATATAACFGICAPDREELMKAMHRQSEWPAVPAIHVRGSEDNGLLGVPHAAWRFSCLTVSPEIEVANDKSASR